MGLSPGLEFRPWLDAAPLRRSCPLEVGCLESLYVRESIDGSCSMWPLNTRRDFLKQTAAATAVGLAGRATAVDAPAPTHYICLTCGMQYAATPKPAEHCLICEDERQYVGHAGQQWTTPEAYRKTHKNFFAEQE